MKYFSLALCLAALASAHLTRAADETDSSSVKISSPGKPVVVRVYVSEGRVNVVGGDAGDTVTVRSDAPPEHNAESRPDGLRVLSSSSSYSLTEKNNVVELNYGRGSFPGASGESNFTVNIPKNASVEVKDGWNTEVSIENISGDIEVKNLNGGVQLKHVGGAALVETMNGEIHADFDAVTQGKAISFTSMNGQVEMHLPAEAKANVRFRTQNGSILTDFPDNVLDTKSTSAGKAPRAQRDNVSADSALAAADRAKADADRARDVATAARDAARARRDAERENENEDDNDNVNSHIPRPHPMPPIPPIAGGKVVSGTLNGGGTDIQVATMNGDIIVRKQ